MSKLSDKYEIQMKPKDAKPHVSWQNCGHFYHEEHARETVDGFSKKHDGWKYRIIKVERTVI